MKRAPTQSPAARTQTSAGSPSRRATSSCNSVTSAPSGSSFTIATRSSARPSTRSSARRRGSAIDPDHHLAAPDRRRDGSLLEGVSPREREVLELMAEGRSNQGIAERLVITERAVQKHITSIFDKL